MSSTRCNFIGGPLDGKLRRVRNDQLIYHCADQESNRIVAYYRSATVPTAFFRDLRQAGWAK